MLIRPWVKALHSGSLPHAEYVKSVFDMSFCRTEYTATGQNKMQFLQRQGKMCTPTQENIQGKVDYMECISLDSKNPQKQIIIIH